MKAQTNTRRTGPVTFRRRIRMTLVLLALVVLVSMSFPVSTLSQKLNDFYFRLRRPQPVSTRVALVLIDDAALARYGRWPWKRGQLAKLIRAVSAQKPQAIGLDILLSEPEDESNDSELEQALAAAPSVVLASKISTSPDSHLWVDPLPRFAGKAAAVGHVQAVIDFDGLCRSIPLEESSIDGSRPAFALKLAEQAGPSLKSLETSSNGEAVQLLEPRAVLIDFRQQLEPWQKHPPFVALSASELLSQNSQSGLAGKIVLIGFGGVDVSDRLFTPVSNQIPMPGVEVNANAVEMLLSERPLTHLGLFGESLLVIAACTAFLWMVVCNPGTRGLVMLAAVLVAGYFGAYLLFAEFHRLLSFGPILIAGLVAAPLAQLENLLIVDREVTSRLQHLTRAMKDPAQVKLPALSDSSSKHLHWKLVALEELQAELSSLYTFNRTLLETMGEGIAVFDAQGALKFNNSAWTSFCLRQQMPADDLSRFGKLIAGNTQLSQVARDGTAWVESEVPIGDELWLFRAVPMPWTSFADQGATLMIAEDITARRQRDQARSEALSFVTHELRTPLIAIQGFSELLMRYPNSPAGSEAPRTIFRETNRLVAMINTYLEVLRLDAGARPLRLSKTSVRAMAEHVEKVVQPLAASARIQMKVELDTAQEYLMCDETLIAGALLNLVSNAIKYGAQGSEVLLRVRTRGDELEFDVHNSGQAIPSEELDRIFDRFYRSSRDEAMPGWGLGLSFVQRICQQHGGRVQVTSDEVAGTSFSFVLPRGDCEVSEVYGER